MSDDRANYAREAALELSEISADDPIAEMASLLRDARGACDLETAAALIATTQPNRTFKSKTLYIAEAGYRFPSRHVTSAYSKVFQRPELLKVYDRLSAKSRFLSLADPAENLVDRLAAGVAPDHADDRILYRPRLERQFDPDFPYFAASPGDALELALCIINEASEREPAMEEIIITLPHAFPGEPPESEFHTRWVRALKAALRKGWDVIGLLPELKKQKEISRWDVVHRVIELAGCSLKGTYAPRVIPSQIADIPDHFVVVPDLGVVHLTAIEPNRRIESASYSPLKGPDPSTEFAAALARRAKAMQRGSHLLLELYCRDQGPEALEENSLAFKNAQADEEQTPGTRYLTKHGLGMLTEPDGVHDARMKIIRQGHGVDIAKKIHRNWLRRRDGFIANLEVHRSCDLVSLSSVQTYASCGATSSFWDAVNVEPATARAHVDFVADLLESHPKYELALVDDAVLQPLSDANWLVKFTSEDQGLVLIETTRQVEGDIKAIDARLDDPMLVRAFALYFENVWSALPAQSKDRTRTIELLRDIASS